MISSHSLWLTLLSSAIVFSYAYCLDLFQALEVHFREPPYQFSTMEFNLMYFFTYLPICLFNIPIGIIIDRSSVTASLFVLLLMSFLSHLVCTLMVQTQISGYIVVMYFMRSFFGVSGEGLYTVQSIIVSKFCRDNYEIVLAIALSLPMVFDSINSLVTTRVYDATNSMIIPWYIGISVCLLSLLSGVILYKYFVYSKPPKEESLLQDEGSQIESAEVTAISQSEASIQQQQQSYFNLRQIRSLSFTFWILIFTSFVVQASITSFLDNANDLLVKRFNIPYTVAGTLLMLPYLLLAIFSIFFGIYMSKRPKTKRKLYVVSIFSYLIGQISLYLLPQTSEPTLIYYIVVTFFLVSLSFGLSIHYSAIIVSVPYLVPQKAVGTAFGVIGSAVGFSACAMPFINVALIDSDSDLGISYRRLNLAYIIMALFAFCLATYVKFSKQFQKIDTKLEDNPQYDSKQSTFS